MKSGRGIFLSMIREMRLEQFSCQQGSRDSLHLTSKGKPRYRIWINEWLSAFISSTRWLTKINPLNGHTAREESFSRKVEILKRIRVLSIPPKDRASSLSLSLPLCAYASSWSRASPRGFRLWSSSLYNTTDIGRVDWMLSRWTVRTTDKRDTERGYEYDQYQIGKRRRKVRNMLLPIPCSSSGIRTDIIGKTPSTRSSNFIDHKSALKGSWLSQYSLRGSRRWIHIRSRRSW